MKFFAIFILLALVAGTGYWYLNKNDQSTGPGSEVVDTTPDTEPVTHNDLIVVEQPLTGQTVSSPLRVTGQARGSWYFEASFPIVVVDWDGRIIGEGYAEAQSDWMTSEYVDFVATVEYELPADVPYRRGAVILRKDNPSGLPEHDDAVEIPVQFE